MPRKNLPQIIGISRILSYFIAISYFAVIQLKFLLNFCSQIVKNDMEKESFSLLCLVSKIFSKPLQLI